MHGPHFPIYPALRGHHENRRTFLTGSARPPMHRFGNIDLRLVSEPTSGRRLARWFGPRAWARGPIHEVFDPREAYPGSKDTACVRSDGNKPVPKLRKPRNRKELRF